jgi:hypothetical protein
MRSEVLTVVNISLLVFWVVTPCGFVARYQRFVGIYCLHLQVVTTLKTKIYIEFLFCICSTGIGDDAGSTFGSVRHGK